jgi:cytoskeleton protein RodZ
LPSFGEKLKQEREKRKISLEQISSSTKIGTRMLQALEEDKFNQLPGGIFNKGFVRAYSHAVGLDEDQIVAEYLQASGDAPPPKTEIGGVEDGRSNEQTIRRLESISDTPSRPLPWGLFAAILLVVALALSLWTHHQREQAGQPVRPAGAASPATQTSSGAPLVVTPQNTSIATASTPGDLGPTAPALPKDSSATEAAAASGVFTVVVHAREESWVSIIADGKSTASEILSPGTDKTIQGRKEIAVKVGNAGGVELSFNGTKIKFGGDSGEVKSITFGPAGVLPDSPTAPATH